MSGIRILGTGSYVPPKVLSNDDLKNLGVDTSDEWIFQRTGIKERRMAEPEVNTSDLAYEASLQALKMAGLEVDEIDLILLATITPDTCCPCGANWLQARLNAPRAIAFDITAACSGFIFGLNVATQRMFHSMAKSLQVPMERFYITIHKYGNISSASCAIAFDEAVRDGSLQQGDLICLPVFGGGLTWGSAMVKW